MMNVTRETKAVLTTREGRVVGFVKDSEPGVISLAVPNDRAKMTPAEARELARWLHATADELSRTNRDTAMTGMTPGMRAAEETYRQAIRRSL